MVIRFKNSITENEVQKVTPTPQLNSFRGLLPLFKALAELRLTNSTNPENTQNDFLYLLFCDSIIIEGLHAPIEGDTTSGYKLNPLLRKRWRLYIFPVHCGPKFLRKRMDVF